MEHFKMGFLSVSIPIKATFPLLSIGPKKFPQKERHPHFNIINTNNNEKGPLAVHIIVIDVKWNKKRMANINPEAKQR